jgi:6-phosphofructokinase 2
MMKSPVKNDLQDRILTVTMNPALDVSTKTERLEAGAKIRCERARREPGGGGINVSRAIHLLG